MKRPDVISFEEWLKTHQTDEDVEIKCGACSGTGECECHCGDAHDCGECDGSGVSKDGADLKKKYQEQVAADLKKWGEWNGRAA